MASNYIKTNEINMGDGKFTEETQHLICASEALKRDSDESSYSKNLGENIAKWYESQNIAEFFREPEESLLYSGELIAKTKKSELNFDSAEVITRACPVGLFYYRNIPDTILFSRATCSITHDNNNSQVASVAAGLMTLYGMTGVPTGVWASEILTFASGIDNEFVEMIKTASELASKYIAPEKASSSFLEGSRETAALALYCCMMGRTYKNSILCSLKTSTKHKAAIASIVGACCGARDGFSAIPEEWRGKIEDLEELLKLADKMFNEVHGLNV